MSCNHKRGPRCCDARKRERHNPRAPNLVEARRDLYILRGRRALLLDLLANGTATADDVWDVTPLPEGVNPRCLSAVPGVLARLGIILGLERVRSVRPERHGARVALWVLVDREKALRWLAEHPDRPDADNRNQGGTGSQGLSSSVNSNEPTPTAGTAGAGLEV